MENVVHVSNVKFYFLSFSLPDMIESATISLEYK